MNSERQNQHNDENLLDKMKNFKYEYYKTNSSNFLFKKKQKQQYAETICSQFDVPTMIANTIRVLPDSNTVLVDYELFKLFVNDNIYELFMDYTIQIFDYFFNNNISFNMQINTKGLTVSGIERYKGFINLFCMKTIEKNYSLFINEILLYNTPTMIDSIISIIKPFIEKSIYEKIKIARV